jgi:hypothetical protein
MCISHWPAPSNSSLSSMNDIWNEGEPRSMWRCACVCVCVCVCVCGCGYVGVWVCGGRRRNGCRQKNVDICTIIPVSFFYEVISTRVDQTVSRAVSLAIIFRQLRKRGLKDLVPLYQNIHFPFSHRFASCTVEMVDPDDTCLRVLGSFAMGDAVRRRGLEF